MKANELRIGNYCKEITYLKNEVVKTSVEHFESIELGEINLSPIPITEEWLFKFGFYRNSSSDLIEFFSGDKNQTLLLEKIDENTFIEHNYGIHIKQVHQLQNLYFALTGEELEIKEL